MGDQISHITGQSDVFMPSGIFNVEATYQRLQRRFGDRVRRNEPLALHSAFGVGGTADIWLTVDMQNELTGLVSFCAEEHCPLLVIGNASNIIFTEGGVRGIVARMAGNEYHIDEEANGTALLSASAGCNWPNLARELAPLGWRGLEFGVGIPGTLGGGLVSNAGAHAHELGEILEWIEMLDARGCNMEGDALSLPIRKHYKKEDLDLGYRYSRFRKGHESVIDAQGKMLPVPHQLIEPTEIILTLGIRLQRETPRALIEHISEYRARRLENEPLESHTGSIFKDTPQRLAKDLIEQVGLKGFTMGKAQFSERNANYIVNRGDATTNDIVSLVEMAHRQVLEKTNINLELNVELRGA
ncbi:UDP-N-acetylmuramate dehydrogenase [Dictyobacter arantiisoli]|uniref:UDP-N-acetylenolpyruvoylglucosamine reductase n=1 Tax=Dictyobacter arantiisoli TaxID=2014874 RepID=A0A5A5TJP8_9CHLR|nr:UDP-N-acetylmuramate dehydrogenase [Dictyobacter arantiisoli]GCF11114.1 UDP-N-acetylenolpyruvoylglucosamine reductase [Dictyobacter arantiisoli]